jgi:hypothetical protein
MIKLGRIVRGLVAGSALVALFQTPSCVGTRGGTCYSNTDCKSGSFCADSGFCDYECKSHIDCPCGSTCIDKCGICLRDDLRGPATCFPLKRGLSTDEVLGACAVEPTNTDSEMSAAGGSGGGNGGSDDERLCDPHADAPACLASPPLGGSGGAGGAGGSGGEPPVGGEGGTAGMGGISGQGGASGAAGMSGGDAGAPVAPSAGMPGQAGQEGAP